MIDSSVKLNVTTDLGGQILIQLDSALYKLQPQEAVRLAMKLLIAEQEVATRRSDRLNWKDGHDHQAAR